MKLFCALASLSFAIATQASAATIDFGSAGQPAACAAARDGTGPLIACSDYSTISQTYGDIAGSVDVTYTALRPTGWASLSWWSSDYNNLFGVAFANGNDANSHARIEIKTLNAGDSINLASFALGAYSNAARNTAVNIYAIGSSIPLFAYLGSVGNPGDIAATNFAPNITVLGGLWLEWHDSAANVGIDSIRYDVIPAAAIGAVPESSTWAMMLAGFGIVGAAMRRRLRPIRPSFAG
jgi:PEP-CTERM motif